jgi:hypothetical protein
MQAIVRDLANHLTPDGFVLFRVTWDSWWEEQLAAAGLDYQVLLEEEVLMSDEKMSPGNLFRLNRVVKLTPRQPGPPVAQPSAEGTALSDQRRSIALDAPSPAPGETSAAPASEAKGGIDLTHLPIVTQPAASLGTVPLDINAPLARRQSPLGTVPLPEDALNKEWQQIQRMLQGGIIPSSQRIKEYVLASCCGQDCQEQIGLALSLIADILRLEEESCAATDARLRQVLVLLESGQPAGDLQLALSKV